MRILLVNKFAHVTGGADRHVLLLRRALRAKGHFVVLLSTTGGDADFEVPLTVSHSIRDSLSARRGASVAWSALWNSSVAREMDRVLEHVRPHVVHTHKLYPQLSVAPVMVARRRHIPVVQTVHDYEFISSNALDHSGGLLDRREARKSYRLLNNLTFVARRRLHAPSVAEWISVSEAVAQRYRACGLLSTVLPNFVEGGSAQAAAGGRDGVVFVGRLTEEKGVREVIALAKSLPDTPVSIAGWGPLAPEVEAAAQKLTNLDFAGRVEPEAVQTMLAGARVAVVPSMWEEPGAVSVLEAMAVGTPLVVYRVGGIAEYVEDAGAGLVVDATVTAMSAGVQSLSRDDALWSECSTRALEAIASRHSAGTYVDRLIVIYGNATRQL